MWSPHLEAVSECEVAVRVEQLRDKEVVLGVGLEQPLDAGVAEERLTVVNAPAHELDGVDELGPRVLEHGDVQPRHQRARTLQLKVLDVGDGLGGHKMTVDVEGVAARRQPAHQRLVDHGVALALHGEDGEDARRVRPPGRAHRQHHRQHALHRLHRAAHRLSHSRGAAGVVLLRRSRTDWGATDSTYVPEPGCSPIQFRGIVDRPSAGVLGVPLEIRLRRLTPVSTAAAPPPPSAPAREPEAVTAAKGMCGSQGWWHAG